MKENIGNLFIVLSLFYLSIVFLRSKKEQIIPKGRKYSKKLIIWGWMGILMAAVFIFRAIILPGPAVWGDAPYFFADRFKEFSFWPLVWESRGRLGVINDLYFIYPLMLFYNSLGYFLHLSNDILIRLIFYLPAIFLVIFSPWILTKYLGFSPLVRLFCSFIYSLNTYFLLLIDGGQVGVALAYGLFPLALLQLFRLKEVKTFFQFFSCVMLFMLIVIADVRLAIIAVLSFIIWVILDSFHQRRVSLSNFKIYFLFVLAILGLSSYWLIPLFFIEPTTGGGIRSDLKLITVLHPLFLYAPHWPLNEFGKIFQPQWYFWGVPLLIFGNLLNRKTFFLSLIFFVFIFLAKGESGFLGNIYSGVLDHLPFGGAFRDSTKFFTPLMLFAGILIGLSIEHLISLAKIKLLQNLLISTVFLYLLLILYPAILGDLNGVLAIRGFPKDLQFINNKISQEPDFLRSVWFPERHPLSFSTEEKPALDAKTLVDLRPFASLNTGISDKFNFLHNNLFLQWLDVFGVRYLIFSGDWRNTLPNEEEKNDWRNLLNLVADNADLERDVESSIPIYKTKTHKPRIFSVDKVVAVIGGDDIYKELTQNENFSIGNQGFLFLEDGKVNTGSLANLPTDAVDLIFNHKDKKDLSLTLLSKYFLSAKDATQNQWAIRSANEYLKWKFELLVNKVSINEFDFGKGIAFSTNPKEKLSFNLPSQNGQYILALRYLSATDSGRLHSNWEGQEDEIPNTQGHFRWFIKETTLLPGNHSLVLENPDGLQVVNVVALIPKSDWNMANELTEELVSRFPTNDSLSIKSNWRKINFQMKSSTEYEIDSVKGWLIFTDTYNNNWQLKQDVDVGSYPLYSAVNGFYVPNNGKSRIILNEGEYVKLGVRLSLITFLVFIIGLAYFYSRNRGKFQIN